MEDDTGKTMIGDPEVEGTFENFNIKIINGKIIHQGTETQLKSEIQKYLDYRSGDWNVLNLTFLGEDGPTEKVKDFQRALGMPEGEIDGKIGKKTLRALLNILEMSEAPEKKLINFMSELKKLKGGKVDINRYSKFQNRYHLNNSFDIKIPNSRQVLSITMDNNGNWKMQEFVLQMKSKYEENQNPAIEKRYRPQELGDNEFLAKTIIAETLENDNSKESHGITVY